MLLNVFLLHFITFASANQDLFDLLYDGKLGEGNETVSSLNYHRFPRQGVGDKGGGGGGGKSAADKGAANKGTADKGGGDKGGGGSGSGGGGGDKGGGGGSSGAGGSAGSETRALPPMEGGQPRAGGGGGGGGGGGEGEDDSKPQGPPSCDQLADTKTSPFVVILLFRTSGRYLGMGSIIGDKTVLTASRAVEVVVNEPTDLYVLAGWKDPWWGKGAQVKRAKEILLNDDANMAIVNLKKAFKFDENVSPIKLPSKAIKGEGDAFAKVYSDHYAVFGIPRSSYDVPGEKVPKGSSYVMKVETRDIGPGNQHKECKEFFKDIMFSETNNICTMANGTYNWGCIGSPTIAVTNTDTLQVATITRAPITEADSFQIHTRIGPFLPWIRSQTYVKFNMD